jgi:hypothetical protein
MSLYAQIFSELDEERLGFVGFEQIVYLSTAILYAHKENGVAHDDPTNATSFIPNNCGFMRWCDFVRYLMSKGISSTEASEALKAILKVKQILKKKKFLKHTKKKCNLISVSDSEFPPLIEQALLLSLDEKNYPDFYRFLLQNKMKIDDELHCLVDEELLSQQECSTSHN